MLKEKLRELTSALLYCEDKQEGERIGQTLFDVLKETLDLDVDQRKLIPTASKGALSAYDSAFCIAYPVRNKAILQAMLKAMQSFENPKILYIGPGPFAPFFIFPLLLGHSAEFTLVEINPYAIQTMSSLVVKLGFEDFVLQTIEADAIIWQTDQLYDIILCETTDIGLKGEDTLPIYQNLKKQLPDAIYIPKDVVVLAGSKTLNTVQAFDSLNAAIKRGYLRTDFPYSVKEKGFLQNKVIMDDDIIIEPNTSIITTPLYIE